MSKENPIIAVDMLGVDKGKPGKVECKALEVILKKNLFPEAEFILIGCREQIIKALNGLGGIEVDKKTGEVRLTGRVKEIIDAPERIRSNLEVLNKEGLKEARALDSGVKKCYELVSEGKADALVSCAHTGFQAHWASSQLGRMSLSIVKDEKEGEEREGGEKGRGNAIRPSLSIAVTVPNPNEKTPTEFSDVGSSLPPENVFEKAQQLILKALMALPLGAVSKKRVNPKDPKRPKLFIFSNGTEPEKAPRAVQYAHAVLEKFKDFFNYGGLMESSFFQKKDDIEIVIDDGFSGNKELKVMEDVGKGIKNSVKNYIFGGFKIPDASDMPHFRDTRYLASIQRGLTYLGELLHPRNLWCLHNIWRGLGYLMLRKVFKTFSPDNHAGGLIYGVNKIAVKSHGSSTPKAVTVAIGKTVNFVKEDIIGQVQELFKGLPKELAEVVMSIRKLADMLGMDGEKVELAHRVSSLSEISSGETLQHVITLMQQCKTVVYAGTEMSEEQKKEAEEQWKKALNDIVSRTLESMGKTIKEQSILFTEKLHKRPTEEIPVQGNPEQ